MSSKPKTLDEKIKGDPEEEEVEVEGEEVEEEEVEVEGEAEPEGQQGGEEEVQVISQAKGNQEEADGEAEEEEVEVEVEEEVKDEKKPKKAPPKDGLVSLKRRKSLYEGFDEKQELFRPEFRFDENDQTKEKMWELMDTYLPRDKINIQKSIVKHI